MVETVLLALSAFFALLAVILLWRSPKVQAVTRDELDEIMTATRDELRADMDRVRGDVGDVRAEISQTREIVTTAREQQVAMIRDSLSTFAEHNDAQFRTMSAELLQALAKTRDELDRAVSQQVRTVSDRVAATHTAQTDQLNQARKVQDESFAKVSSSIDQVSSRVNQAVTDVQASLVDLARQHNEAKAQTAMQFCEALINSLGSLRNQIAASIAAPRESEMLEGSSHQGASTSTETTEPDEEKIILGNDTIAGLGEMPEIRGDVPNN